MELPKFPAGEDGAGVVGLPEGDKGTVSGTGGLPVASLVGVGAPPVGVEALPKGVGAVAGVRAPLVGVGASLKGVGATMEGVGAAAGVETPLTGVGAEAGVVGAETGLMTLRAGAGAGAEAGVVAEEPVTTTESFWLAPQCPGRVQMK